MKRFLIKVTYLSGRHKGKSFLLKKGGYVAGENEHVCESDTYKTETIAKRICTLYTNNNQRDYLDERRYNDYRISKGYESKEFFIHELESYEPYELSEDRIIFNF